jgi:hypothetical protein
MWVFCVCADMVCRGSSSWLKIYYEKVGMLVAKSDKDRLSIG